MRASSIWQSVVEHAPEERRLVLPVAGGQSAGGNGGYCFAWNERNDGAAAFPRMQE